VLARLKQRGVRSIVGNHDKTVLYSPNHPIRSSPTIDPAYLRYLGELPTNIVVDLGTHRLQMFHGSPWDDEAGRVTPYLYPQDKRQFDRLAEVQADVIVLGHTHVPYAQQLGKTLVVNPGSCSEPRDGTDTPCCAAIDSQTLEVEFRRFCLAPA
jgi:putative phosphoesterase